jgi:hypothetical protein
MTLSVKLKPRWKAKKPAVPEALSLPVPFVYTGDSLKLREPMPSKKRR